MGEHGRWLMFRVWPGWEAIVLGLAATHKYQDISQASAGRVLINDVKETQKYTVLSKKCKWERIPSGHTEHLLLGNCPSLQEGRENQTQAERPAEALSPSVAFVYNLILKPKSLKHINLSAPVQPFGYLPAPPAIFPSWSEFSRLLETLAILRPSRTSYMKGSHAELWFFHQLNLFTKLPTAETIF